MTTETNTVEQENINNEETVVQATGNDNNGQPVKKKRFKLKMPSALAIIIGVVIFATILTWIPHASGKATELLDADGNIVYASGTLGAWQNWIIWNAVGTGDFSLDSLSAINEADANEAAAIFGLEGYWDTELGYFVTDYSVPWSISGYSTGEFSRFGLFDSIKAMVGGYWMAWDVAFYIIGMYAIVLLLMKTNTLKDGVASLVKGLGGREILLVPILFTLFSLGGTLFGMQEETLGLIPIIIPVLIVAGFDAPTGLLVAVVGTTSGIASSVLDPFSIGVMAAGLNTGIGTGILERLILFIVITSVTCTMVTLYAIKARKKPEKSIDPDAIEANKIWAEEQIGDINELETMTKQQKWALSLFALAFIWMIFSLMPWTTWFPGLYDASWWTVFSSFFYGQVLLGEWYFVELGIMFLIFIVAIGKIFKYSNGQIAGVIKESAIDMFGVITIIAFSRSISVILQSSGLTYGMIYGMVDPAKLEGIGILTFALIWLGVLTLMAFFIPSTSGLAGITAPIIGGIITTAAGGGEEHTRLMIVAILMIYPLAQGCVNMFSPTTGIVVVQSEVARVNYGKALPMLALCAGVTMVLGIITSILVIGGESLAAGIPLF